MRFVAGMLVAPFAAVILFALLATTVHSLAGSPPDWASLPADIALFSLYAYPIGWLLGLPSYVAYRHYGLVSLKSYLFGGAIGGAFVGTVFFIYVPHFWLILVLAASFSCAVFWRIAVRNTANNETVLGAH